LISFVLTNKISKTHDSLDKNFGKKYDFMYIRYVFSIFFTILTHKIAKTHIISAQNFRENDADFYHKRYIFLQHFVLTSLLVVCLSVCLSVCYKSHNRYSTHFYLSNLSEIWHTCVKLETMHESIDRINY
jgi:hypothetical protein